ncbi:MAG TPA: thymidine phosphorylase [Deinococcales bacterium]|nr:thymidine phosphorylase [Deinococcales bacterium]
MTVPEIIERKREGREHTRAEIEALLLPYVRGEVPDYQVAAWLMAVFLRGMTPAETTALTEVMAASGEQLDLSGLPRTVDKHSTGGVGDKTSLVLAPILAACGLTVAKMSGRGLAHTGGTIDKLESIPGWRSELSEEEFLRQAREVGLALVGQSRNLAPADGLLYALRDVTATVPSVPLIASSIMSKKLAAGSRTIVLDVKVGAGAFMPTLERARDLATAMVEIGTLAGRRVRAVLTDMEAPLGRMAGNALEVREAIDTLRGEGPDDLRELCLILAEEALLAEGASPQEARDLPAGALSSGRALAKLAAFVAAQGGDERFVREPDRLPRAPGRVEVTAPAGGYLERVDALAVGRAVLALGGGRERKGDPIDHAVGVELLAKPGDQVGAGQPLLAVHHRDGRGLDAARNLLASGTVVSPEPVPPQPLILDRVPGR